MKNVLRVAFWIVALILFPITAGLYFIWPSKVFRDRMSKGWRTFWWIIYAIQAFIGIASKVFACIVILLMAYEDSGPIIIRDDVPESDYKTSADFYKLTGVEFPELKMIDSLFFQDGGLSTNYWSEYKFVPKDGISKRFYKSLERAVKSDSTHWHHGPVSNYFYSVTGEEFLDDLMVYHYEIYPDQEPVDRSRGMCDRIVKLDDGRKIRDWDGNFITVDIINGTIVLREGWVR